MNYRTIFDDRILDEFEKRFGFNLSSRLLMACYVGSETHGTRDPSKAGIDDIDIFGVIIPPANNLLGLTEWEHFNLMVDELDVTVFSLKKWASLVLKNNPNMLCTLWLKPEHYMSYTSGFDLFLKERNI